MKLISFIQATLEYVVFINPMQVRAVMPYLEQQRVDQKDWTYKVISVPCGDRSIIVIGDGDDDNFLVRGSVGEVARRLEGEA